VNGKDVDKIVIKEGEIENYLFERRIRTFLVLYVGVQETQVIDNYFTKNMEEKRLVVVAYAAQKKESKNKG